MFFGSIFCNHTPGFKHLDVNAFPACWPSLPQPCGSLEVFGPCPVLSGHVAVQSTYRWGHANKTPSGPRGKVEPCASSPASASSHVCSSQLGRIIYNTLFLSYSAATPESAWMGLFSTPGLAFRRGQLYRCSLYWFQLLMLVSYFWVFRQRIFKYLQLQTFPVKVWVCVWLKYEKYLNICFFNGDIYAYVINKLVLFFSVTSFIFDVGYCSLSSGESHWTSNRSLIIELPSPLQQTWGSVPKSPLSAPCTSSRTFPLLCCYTEVWHGARFSPLMSSYLPPSPPSLQLREVHTLRFCGCGKGGSVPMEFK